MGGSWSCQRKRLNQNFKWYKIWFVCLCLLVHKSVKLCLLCLLNTLEWLIQECDGVGFILLSSIYRPACRLSVWLLKHFENIDDELENWPLSVPFTRFEVILRASRVAVAAELSQYWLSRLFVTSDSREVTCWSVPRTLNNSKYCRTNTSLRGSKSVQLCTESVTFQYDSWIMRITWRGL